VVRHASLPSDLDPDEYEIDEDGLVRQIVGPWVRDKHTRIAKYVGISRAVRRKFIGPGAAGATFIDLFAGPGRARIRTDNQIVDGSAMVAWREAKKGGVQFTHVYVGDAHPNILEAAAARLDAARVPAAKYLGPAVDVVDRVLNDLNPHALHFILLDPFGLRALPFEVIKKLATLKHVDMLVHVSAQALQRNLRRQFKARHSAFDVFAPGWREKVDAQSSDDGIILGKILEHWRGLLKAEGMDTAEVAELVSGSGNQRLYWLAFAARNSVALSFWEKIRDLSAEKQLVVREERQMSAI
jgi:three-Cys-motif partner protein